MRNRAGWIGLSVSLACVFSPPLFAQDIDPGARAVKGLSASQLFAFATHAETASADAEAEAVYLALTKDPDVDVRQEARFRLGKLKARRNKLLESATLFRAILDEKPDANAVRLQLAAVLAQMGDLNGARRELRQAQAGGLPPEVAQVVRQYAAALRSRKPWGGSFELAFAPDSNINRATSATTLDTVIAPLNLSQDAQARSGIGVKESSQIYARQDLGQHLTLVPRASSQAVLYRASQFDDISVSAQLGLEWRIKADRVTPSAGYTWRWYGGGIYAHTQSLSLDWLHPAGQRAQFDMSASVNRVRYATNTLQDGMIITAAVSYERALSARSGGEPVAVRQSPDRARPGLRDRIGRA